MQQEEGPPVRGPPFGVLLDFPRCLSPCLAAGQVSLGSRLHAVGLAWSLGSGLASTLGMRPPHSGSSPGPLPTEPPHFPAMTGQGPAWAVGAGASAQATCCLLFLLCRSCCKGSPERWSPLKSSSVKKVRACSGSPAFHLPPRLSGGGGVLSPFARIQADILILVSTFRISPSS